MPRVEAPGDDARPLDQEDDLVELAARVAPRGPGLGRGGVEVGHDAGAPPLVVGDHRDRLQGLVVRGGVADLDRAAQEAVALAAPAGDEPVQLEGHVPLVELGDDPAHRAGEPQAGPVAPAHGLGEAQPVNHPGDHLGHQLVDRAPLLAPLGEDEAAALSLVDDQLVHRDALTAGEALGGAGRGAVGVEGRLGRRPANAARGRGDAVRHARGDEGEAPRRHRQRDLRRRLQPERLERGGQELRGLGDDLAAGARGELLAADLDEEVRHAAPPGRGP